MSTRGDSLFRSANKQSPVKINITHKVGGGGRSPRDPTTPKAPQVAQIYRTGDRI